MIVAVASPFAPPQHCPMLGHRASSHTVCRFSPRRSRLILLYDAEVGTDVLRYAGSRGLRPNEDANGQHNAPFVHKRMPLIFPSYQHDLRQVRELTAGERPPKAEKARVAAAYVRHPAPWSSESFGLASYTSSKPHASFYHARPTQT